MALDVLELMESFVAIDSQNPGVGEAEISRHVDEIARSLGFESRIVETAPGRANVLVSIDAGGGRSLGLSGHLDTKPIGEAANEWNTPPLEMVVQGDLAYGLGTTDMKGAIAAMLVAAERWSGQAETGRLELVFTADEEAGSRYGAYALSEEGLVSVDALLIGEPSGIDEPWEAIFLVSRGICSFTVEIEGTQGHSGLSERYPTSATVAAAHAVLALAENLEPSYTRNPEYDYHPTVNAGVRVEGGVFFGVHPGRATVSCDIRLVPGMRKEVLDREIKHSLAEAMPSDVAWTVSYREDQLGWMEPVSIDPEHELVIAAQKACQEVLGKQLPYAAYPGGTDATPFSTIAGIPTIASLGPGWLTVAHGPNEHVRVSQLYQAVELYTAIANHYL